MSKFEQFLEQVQTQDDLGKAAALMYWDREVMMPKGGSQERIQQITTLSKLAHHMATSDEFARGIEDASAEIEGSDPDSFEARLLAFVKRKNRLDLALPAEFVQRSALLGGAARQAWVTAREENDFAAFEPHLANTIDLCQEMADYYGYEDQPYDALLDTYEQGMKSAEVRKLFDAVKTATVPLLEAIVDRGASIDDALLHQPFPVAQQIEFAHYIATEVGYDFDRGHLGTVVHPFAINFSRNDARITSRWNENFINPGLFGTLHESGHAMYEQGTSEQFSRTPLARGTSLGIHESQSRSIENLVGRSQGFWQKHFGKLQATFPDQLSGYTVEQFWRAINKVQPSLIRVEADELTYNFHIIMRFELEQEMLNGQLNSAELPDAWRNKIESLLGVVPPDDTLGCLQDVHWSRPSFGYFPTYALGNLYGAQFKEAMAEQDASIVSDLAVGDSSAFVAWMGENIHQYGSKYSPGEIVMKATGKPLSHEPFVRYVTEKFNEIYEL